MFVRKRLNLLPHIFAVVFIGAVFLSSPCHTTAKEGAPLVFYPAIEKFLSANKADESGKQNETFWEHSKQGWFYYETMPSEDEQAEGKKLGQPSIQIDWDAFKKLQAEDIREMLKELKDFAITYPNKKNVANYMVAQKISVNKATHFMTAWQEVLNEHPALDSTVERPTTGFVSFQLENAKKAERKKAITRLARDTNVGLLFFYSDQNYYSVIQKPVFERFLASTNWDPYVYVDVDRNPQLIDQYGIETLPEIWIVLQNGSRARVAAGARTADIITEKIISAYEKITGEKMFPDPYTYMENELTNDLDLEK